MGQNYEILGFNSRKILEKSEPKSSYGLLGGMDSPYGPNYEILGFKSQKILEKYELKSRYGLLGSTDSLHGPIYEDFVVDISRFRD